MRDILIVVDMQNDFVTDALGTKEATAIVPAVVERVKTGIQKKETVLFTRDTHQENYMDTQEGKNLPVKHCVEGTHGWQIVEELLPYVGEGMVIDKPTFGSRMLGERLFELQETEGIGKITLIGLCTDICVISNAMLAKAFLPEVPIVVESGCCAGVTPESHERALEAMKMCQVQVI
ncbi:MAG: cysteine hydrolase family protein [Lachnospiraceae bacterium]